MDIQFKLSSAKSNGMQFNTRFKIDDIVWVLESKKQQPRRRKVTGIKIQLIKDTLKILYSFETDQSMQHNGYYDYLQLHPMPMEERFFWVYEKFCFESEEELMNTVDE